MKKKVIIYYLAVLAVMVLTGCVRDDFSVNNSGSSDDGSVTLMGTLAIPEMPSMATRALSDIGAADSPEPYLESLKLYIFVFEDTGAPESNYLRELVYEPKFTTAPSASPDTDHQTNTLLNFSAKFDGTAENAILHIVATADPNFEEQLHEVTDRSELGMFSGATGIYSGDGEAYWRRVELGCAINDANKGEINAKLSHVQLIRNFARVTVTVADDAAIGLGTDVKFLLDGFVVVNAADKGYVAAYNEQNGVDELPAFLTDVFDLPNSEADLTNAYYRSLVIDHRYLPARHPLAGRINPDDKLDWIEDFKNTDDVSPKYLYERSAFDQRKSFVVIKGHFSGNSDTRYIKLDIGSVDKGNIDDETNEPFGVFETYDIVRNISYDITVTKIATMSVGSTDPESAIVAPPANNISTSIETKKMLRIYDGVDRLEVNATTIVIVDGYDVVEKRKYINADTDEMRWRYTTDYVTNETNYTSDRVKWNYPGYAFAFDGGVDPDGVIKSWSNGIVDDQVTTPKNGVNGNDSGVIADGWRGFRFEYNEPGDKVRTKTIRLYAPSGLTRDINFILRKRWEFVTDNAEISDNYAQKGLSNVIENIEIYPGYYSFDGKDGSTIPPETMTEMRTIGKDPVGASGSAPLTVVFELPDDLPEAIFPLTFKIGFDRQNVDNAYVGDAVVTTGPSMFQDLYPDLLESQTSRLQYEKTIDWQYYNGSGDPGDYGHKLVTARFLTINDLATELRDSPGATSSTTYVRVENKYFIMGEGSFVRSN